MAESTEALLVIDVQNDFCPGGALPVPDGDAVIGPINRLIGAAAHVLLTQDWHPAGHLSFASSHPGRQPYDSIDMPYGQQVLWPDHCVQGSRGAEFHPALAATRAELVIRKGYNPAVDSYSAFFENDRSTATGLSGYLRSRGIRRLALCGLATDFCVLYSALDALAEGFTVTVYEDACRGIDMNGSLAKALADMQAAGAIVRRSSDNPK